MSNFKLSFDFDLEIMAFAIVSPKKDFQIAMILNQNFGLDLYKIEDIVMTKKMEMAVFSNFIFEDDTYKRTFRLISNKSYLGHYLPEHKAADYILCISGEEVHRFDNQLLLKTLNERKEILTAYEIAVEKLKEKENLLFE